MTPASLYTLTFLFKGVNWLCNTFAVDVGCDHVRLNVVIAPALACGRFLDNLLCLHLSCTKGTFYTLSYKKDTTYLMRG